MNFFNIQFHTNRVCIASKRILEQSKYFVTKSYFNFMYLQVFKGFLLKSGKIPSIECYEMSGFVMLFTLIKRDVVMLLRRGRTKGIKSL